MISSLQKPGEGRVGHHSQRQRGDSGTLPSSELSAPQRGTRKTLQWNEFTEVWAHFLQNPTRDGELPRDSHSRKPLLPWGLTGWGKGTAFPGPSESWWWQELDLEEQQPLLEPWQGRERGRLKIPPSHPPACLCLIESQRARDLVLQSISQPPGAQNRSKRVENGVWMWVR